MKQIFSALFLLVLSAHSFAHSCEENFIKQMTENTNNDIHARVDDVTTLTKIECKNGTLKYTYELNDTDGIKLSKFDDAKKKLFSDVQRDIIKNLYCTTFSEIQDYTNSVIWSYRFNENVFG